MGLENKHTSDKVAAEGDKGRNSAAELSAEQWQSNSKVEPRNAELKGTQLTNLTIEGLDNKKDAKSDEPAKADSKPSADSKVDQNSRDAKPDPKGNDKHEDPKSDGKSGESKPGDLKNGEVKDAGEKAKDNPEELEEANALLLKSADAVVNQSIYKLPKWAKSMLPVPPPELGCVSSFSNRYRETLKMSGRINSTEDSAYKELYQVNMTEMNKAMGLNSSDPSKRLMKEINASEVKEGDIIEGQNPGTTTRHVGIVGGIENGKRMVYDNYGGTWRKEGLDDRFGRYKEEKYFRAYLPPKK